MKNLILNIVNKITVVSIVGCFKASSVILRAMPNLPFKVIGAADISPVVFYTSQWTEEIGLFSTRRDKLKYALTRIADATGLAVRYGIIPKLGISSTVESKCSDDCICPTSKEFSEDRVARADRVAEIAHAAKATHAAKAVSYTHLTLPTIYSV